ncbi:MAG TPA: tetratricopeptide repeat protein [Bryobacteraceae bacterium]|nr:tetratricopeptide repeat protein [Bryobacteraceae bacterium]
MRTVLVLFTLLAPSLTSLQAQTATPAREHLERAYTALRVRAYDTAVTQFLSAIALEPGRAAIRKDLAYTFLKIGEPEAARDQFAEAMKLDPADDHVALEYAFLCYETRQQATARSVFDRIRHKGNSTAERAFQNIDRPLQDGLNRWLAALELSPDNFSAHQEVAQLAEQRSNLPLAAQHYEKAWQLRPDMREFLLHLGRVWALAGENEKANAALLAASRGAEPRTADAARQLLPVRYPYVYEFQRALALDPKNVELRRELAYLHLAMENSGDAELEFRGVIQQTPEDILSAAQLGFLRLSRDDLQSAMPLLHKALESGDKELKTRIRSALKIPSTPDPAPGVDAKVLAERSLEAGYLKDALKYLRIAHEENPRDYGVLLQLGRTANILRDDRSAVEWFRQGRQSPNPDESAEASRAYKNLRASLAPFRTTAWMFPFYSSRWKDVFTYGQIKTEVKLGSFPLRPYVSTRFIGDTRGVTAVSAIAPQYLSESSFIFAVGLATTYWHGLTAWAEAGEAVRYRKRNDVGLMIPDYRGGVSHAFSYGHRLDSETRGAFFETNADAVFISRFQNDVIGYAQSRTGYTIKGIQLYWNSNATLDSKRQYWANFIETGPGLKFQAPGRVVVSVNALRGHYNVMEANPRGPIFYDLRIGLWYALTH